MQLPSVFSTLGNVAGMTHRVGEFLEVLESIELEFPGGAVALEDISERRSTNDVVYERPSEAIELMDVTVIIPGTTRELFKDLTVTLPPGACVVETSASVHACDVCLHACL